MKNIFFQMKKQFREFLENIFRSSIFFWCIFSLIGIIGLFGWWKWVLSPLWEIEASDAYNISWEEERVGILKDEMNERKTFLKEVDVRRAEDWNRLNFFLPNTSDFSTLLLELSSMAEANSWKLESIAFSLPQESKDAIRSTLKEKENVTSLGKFQIDVALSGDGGYESWKKIIENFEHSLRFLTLSSFSYEPGVSQFHFQLVGYWFREHNAKDIAAFFLKDKKALENTLAFFSWKNFGELQRWSRPEYISHSKKVFVPSLSPSAPQGLFTYDAGEGNMIILSWNEFEDDISRIHIFRSANPFLSGAEIANVPANAQYFMDREVENGVVYYYELRAKNKDGIESVGGEKVPGKSSDRIPPSPVTDLQYDTKENGVVAIRWKNPLNKDFDYVNIYRSESLESRKERIATNIKNGQYNDDPSKTGKTYYYFFSSVDSSGNESQQIPLEEFLGKSLPFE